MAADAGGKSAEPAPRSSHAGSDFSRTAGAQGAGTIWRRSAKSHATAREPRFCNSHISSLALMHFYFIRTAVRPAPAQRGVLRPPVMAQQKIAVPPHSFHRDANFEEAC